MKSFSSTRERSQPHYRRRSLCSGHKSHASRLVRERERERERGRERERVITAVPCFPARPKCGDRGVTNRLALILIVIGLLAIFISDCKMYRPGWVTSKRILSYFNNDSGKIRMITGQGNECNKLLQYSN